MSAQSQRWAVLVVHKDGEQGYLIRGLCSRGPIALFPSREAAEEQRQFLLEGISDEVQSINVVPAPGACEEGE